MDDVPERLISDDSKDSHSDQENNEEKPEAKRYPLQELNEAPVIQKKVLLTQPTPVFPTSVAMLARKGGVEERRVPSIFYVIREHGRVGGMLLANQNGERIGWVLLNESASGGYEWSTNHVWVPHPNRVPVVYRTKEQADAGDDTIEMPVDLIDEDYVFPVLKGDSKSELFLIGRPLPRTVETSLRFPVWVLNRTQATPDSAGSIDLLVSRRDLGNHIRNLQYLVGAWSELSADEREDITRVQPLLNATNVAICSLACGNVVLRPTREAMRSTAFYLQTTMGDGTLLYYATKTIDDIAIMDDDEFAHFVNYLKATLAQLRDAAEADKQYSIFKSGQRTQGIRVDW